MIPLLLLLGLVAFASRARAAAPSSSATPAPTSKEVAARIVRETQEIIDGKRETYTDDQATVDAELERARRAVALAQQKEAQTPASSSSSSPRPPAKPPAKKPPSMSVGPIVQKQAAAPAAAKKPAPAGTDLALAKQTAASVAAHLKQKGRDKYDRKVLKLWQTRAGLPPDGIYGRGTAAALKYFGAAAPAAFFAQGTASYTPPA